MFKNLKGKKVVIAGLDKSGIGAVKYFSSKGADIVVCDLRNRLELQKALKILADYEYKAEFSRYSTKTFLDADLIITSMKKPHDERVLKMAKEKGIPIYSEYEYTSSLITKPTVCITGTNGKSTTSILFSEMLRLSGKKAYITGHIGKSIFEYLLDEKLYDVLIIELDADYFKYSWDFDFSDVVLLNISDEKLVERADSWQTFADHVKLYSDYICKITENKNLIYSRDCDNVFTVVSNTKSKGVPFSVNFAPSDLTHYKYGGAYVCNSDVTVKINSNEESTYCTSCVKLKGSFNKENLMVSVFLAKKYGATDDAINYIMTNFSGIEHRLEFVQRKNNVHFYNDARASTIRGLIRSLKSFDQPIILIAGGKDRGEDYHELIPVIKTHVKTLILLGESKENMNRIIGDFTQTFIVGTFEEAVILSYQKSKSGDIILFSPGCLPSDKFTRIEERGKYYKTLINTF